MNLRGSIIPEGSKSILNRVLIISSFLDRQIRIVNTSACDDVQDMLLNLHKIGLHSRTSKNQLILSPDAPVSEKGYFFVKDSATAFRFLLARLSIIPGYYSRIKAGSQLWQRPHGQIVEALQKLGVFVEKKSGEFTVTGSFLNGGRVTVPSDVSSQFISALLLIAPHFREGLELVLTGIAVSRPYLDMTLKIMADFGITGQQREDIIAVNPGQVYQWQPDYVVEPDVSSACYFWALGALNRGEIAVGGISPGSIQPDIQFLSVLRSMGADVNISADKIVVRNAVLKGVQVDMRNMPDQVPTLAVLSLFASSPTVIRGIQHLRYKESDRIAGLLEQLGRLGVKISYQEGEMCIEPLSKAPNSRQLDPGGDHRLAMSFALLTRVFPMVSIKDPVVVNKSYPRFWRDLASLQNT
ncbi:MAG: 3-phosphoshikimate 1-carboxyvinyltransferase [Candidatus Cloacimonetes bacterium]|nr:3-phosphoshikimate 1-carboxyvinyltransferase [Candidatus Cloacimonadota bacterium]